jgi:branched-chain amino acid transport system substrate-binding protein
MNADMNLTSGNESMPTRRTVLGAGGAVGLALLNPTSVFAQGADASSTIRIGFISPRTGALAGFGEADGFILGIARATLKDGLTVGGKKYAVEILDRDTQSDPARASQLAKTLINSEKVDLMLAISTPETVNPVSDACEAAGVPCLSTVMPWEAWYFGRGAKPGAPSPYKWTYHFSFGVDEFAKCYASQWSLLSTNKKVGALYPNDADGNAIRASLAPALQKAGFTIVDAGPYEDGTTDYSAQIAKFKSEKVEIFNTFPIPPDFAAFWRQAAQQGLTKQLKIAQVAKFGLFPSNVEALGPLGYNLSSACYWHKTFPYKSALTGISGVDLANSYEKSANKQWTQQLGATMALLDAGTEALKTSGNPKDKASVAKALSTLVVTTMIGKVDFTKGPVPNVSNTSIIGTQWVKAPAGSKYKFDYVITENATDPNVPVGAKLLPLA